MILSHKYKFIFFCNGKTGTTSIENALKPFQEGEEYNFSIKGICPAGKHIYPTIIKACLPEDIWNSYFKFTFVRNPWDLFVSGWKYCSSRHLKQLQFPNFLQHPRGALQVHKKINYWQLKHMNNQKIFSEEDVDWYFNFLKKDYGLPPYSGRYQYHYVFDLYGQKLVDFVGRFEQLEDNFNTIKEKINLDVELPHLNQSRRSEYRKYFTEASKKRVAELWKRDIKAFGYTFD